MRWAAATGIAVEYRMVSAINHLGSSLKYGHYTSIGEAGDGKFYVFDDASVHLTDLRNALHPSAYIIFYEMLPKSKAAILPSLDRETASLKPLVLSPGCAADLAPPCKV